MPLPELLRRSVETRLAAYCQNRIPLHVRHKIRLEFEFRGNSVTLVEERPSYMNPDEWIKIKVAQFRFDPETKKWSLFWPDRNSRWHRYERLAPAATLDPLLREVDKDPFGVFWG